MEAIEIRKLDIELTPEDVSENNELTVQGYIAVNSPSHILGKEDKRKWREIITPGTFRNALAKARRLGQEIEFLAEHDNKKILASTVNSSLFLEEDDVGLYIDAKISPTSWGQDLYVLVKDGIIKGLSFGMKVLRDDWTMTPDGLPLRTISEIELYEISALKTPAYPTTLLESRGLEIAEIEVPDELEKRNLNGGNNMIGDNQEVTPQMVYNGMTLIAEKLDAIVTKMDTMETEKLVKGLDEAKNVLIEAKAIAEVVGGKDTKIEDENNEEVNEENEVVKTEEKVEEKEDLKPAEEATTEEETLIENDTEEETEEVETKATTEEVETKVEGETVETQEETEVVTDEEETEEEKKKKQVNEIRSWLDENKITEVPEDEE